MRAASAGSATMTPEETKAAQAEQTKLAKTYDRVSTPVKDGRIDTSWVRWREGLPQNTETTGSKYHMNLAGSDPQNAPMSAEGLQDWYSGHTLVGKPRETSTQAQNSSAGDVATTLTDENVGYVVKDKKLQSRKNKKVLESTLGDGIVDYEIGGANASSKSAHGIVMSTGGEKSSIQDGHVTGIMPSVPNIDRITKAGGNVKNIYQEIMTAATLGGQKAPHAVLPDKDSASHPFRMIAGSNDFSSGNESVEDLKAEDASYFTDPKRQTQNKFQGAVTDLQQGGVGAGVQVNRAESGDSLLADFAEFKALLQKPESEGGGGKSQLEAGKILAKAIRTSAAEEGGLTRDGFLKAIESQEPKLAERWRKDDEKRKKLVAATEKMKKTLDKLPKDIAEAMIKSQREDVAKSLASMAGVTDKKQVQSLVRGGRLDTNSSSVGGKIRQMLADPSLAAGVKETMEASLTKLGLVQDFIYRGGASGGTITPIHSGDDFLGMRKRGGVDNALTRNAGGGGTGTINVNVYSNNLEEVKRAIYTAARNVGVGGRKVSRSGTGNFGKMKA
tara:strand:- start:347 stop:2020 length:1674 start_codon:yes stop_codon:yes gene_type:complete